jgi:hypothetical protein
MAQGYINEHTTDYLSLKSRLLAGSSRNLNCEARRDLARA